MIREKLIDCKDEIIKVFDSKATEIAEDGLIILTDPNRLDPTEYGQTIILDEPLLM